MAIKNGDGIFQRGQTVKFIGNQSWKRHIKNKIVEIERLCEKCIDNENPCYFTTDGIHIHKKDCIVIGDIIPYAPLDGEE